MLKGTVKWFDGKKGYGFIKPESGEDVFVHISELQKAGLRTLEEKQTVEFEISTERGRKSAKDIKLA